MSLKDYFIKAQSQSFALGAFNVCNLETIKAIIQASQKLLSPVIISSSPGETDYIEPENLCDIVKNYRRQTGLPIFINLDHAKSLEKIKRAINAGYDMIHFDGSDLSFEDNKKITKQVMAMAKEKNIVVEGELGYISGSSAPFLDQKVAEIQAKGSLTDPDQAQEFVEETRIDVLASFIGNVHGLYKGAKKLDLERLALIKQKTNCFLSLHGGSGTEASEIKEVIKRGVVKVNINTELRVAYKTASQQAFNQSIEVAAYKLMPSVIEAIQKIVEEKIKIFGSQGK